MSEAVPTIEHGVPLPGPYFQRCKITVRQLPPGKGYRFWLVNRIALVKRAEAVTP